MENTTRILVQDFDTDILIIIAHVLLDEGYRVSTCNTYDEAVLAVETVEPDLIFLDFFLRGDQCMEAFERIRKRHPKTPVIALSSNPQYFRQHSKGKFDHFIEKPFVIDTILAAAKQYGSSITR